MSDDLGPLAKTSHRFREMAHWSTICICRTCVHEPSAPGHPFPPLPFFILSLELIIVSRSSPFLENFIHSTYPNTNLPPLWQVIYQEAVRGHHLLFNRHDVEQFDREPSSLDKGAELQIPEEVETIVLHIVECSDLQSMVRVKIGRAHV